MARYHEIAEDMRARIKRGDWKVGQKLPGISALQELYEVERSLGTVRRAQQLLVADGMLRTEQGVGAFVTATEPASAVTDLAATLTEARDLISDALAAVRQTAAGMVTIDVTGGAGDNYFVLDTALKESADRNRAEAQDAHDNGARDIHRQWAETADRLRGQIDAAFESTP